MPASAAPLPTPCDPTPHHRRHPPPLLPGVGTPKSLARALHHYERAYDAGHWRAPYAMALLLEQGDPYAPEQAPDCDAAQRLLWQFIAERSPWNKQLAAALRCVAVCVCV